MKVLVFDGNRHIRRRLEATLQLLGADTEVIFADNDESGLDNFLSEAPDVVLIDAANNGFDVLEAIRRVSDTPVLMLTDRDSDADQQRALELGADDHVDQPFKRQTLVRRVRAVLRRADLPPRARH